MNESQRRELLGRLRRPSNTVGADLPEEITVDGTTVDLTELLFEIEALDAIPPDERDRLEAVKSALRRERLARKRRIEDGEVSYETGRRLVESVRGIDRAINALEELDTPDIEEQLRRKQLQDARELVSLVRQRE